MSFPYRAEVIGSLLRPEYLSRARGEHESGRLGVHEFKEVEDRAVDQAIALQEGAGLDVVNDGEMRRLTFFDQFITALEGISEIPGEALPFHGDNADEDVSFQSPVSVTDRVRRRRMLTVEEFAYARGRARRPLKVTLPSPLMLFLVWSPSHSRDAYSDPFELFSDGVEIIREEARELAALGCRYIQIDAPDLCQLVDQTQRESWDALGIPTHRVFTEGIDMINAVADVPGVTFGLHLCRGNYQSKWIGRGGYEEISEQTFRRATNYDAFLLEYDDARSGSFEPLADIPDDKIAVLGLVSTKHEELESPETLRRRIEEASRHFPRQQLALSTQCGFASEASGNLIGEAAQEEKLHLVADVAHNVWG